MMPLTGWDALYSLVAIALGVTAILMSIFSVRSVARRRKASEEPLPAKDVVARLEPGKREFRGRLRASGETITDARGEACLATRVRVMARSRRRKHHEVLDSRRSVLSILEDDSGTCEIDLSDAALPTVEEEKAYRGADLARELPEVAELLRKAVPALVDRLLQRLEPNDPNKEKPFRVARYALPDGLEVDVEAEVTRVSVGEDVAYRSATETALIVRATSVRLRPTEKKLPRSRDFAPVLLSLAGALLLAHGLALWALSAMILRAVD
jgi:hypothetical protein